MRQALKSAERFATPGSGPEPATSSNQIGGTPMSKSDLLAPQGTTISAEGTHSMPEEYTGVVSSGSVWNGNLKVEGSVRVDGRLTGEVEARDAVVVIAGAQVDAAIRASVVVIAGKFQGEIDCRERLEVMPTGQIKGSLKTKLLVVHEGAIIDGPIEMTNRKTADAPPARSTDQSAKSAEISPPTTAPVSVN